MRNDDKVPLRPGIRVRRLMEVVVPAVVLAGVVFAMVLVARSSRWPWLLVAGGAVVIVCFLCFAISVISHAALSKAPPDSWEKLRSLISEAIRPGYLKFAAPDHMRQGSRARVSVVISPNQDANLELILRRLGDDTSAAQPAGTRDIKASSVMSVECQGDGLTVMRPLWPSEQAIIDDALWQFDIIADSHGLRSLWFFVNMSLPVPDFPELRRPALRLEHKINVEKRLSYEARIFWVHNWQWVLATFIALGAAITGLLQLIG